MFRRQRIGWLQASFLALGVVASSVSAAETNAPAGNVTNAPPVAVTNAPATSTNVPEGTAAKNLPKTAAAALTPEQMFEGGTNTYNNWIEFGAGGFMTKGSKPQFQQWNQNSRGAFGGITDFHLQEVVATNTTLTLDGRSIYDEHDYKLSLGLEREKLGYLRFKASEFRTWENGDGGFFPPTGSYYPLPGNTPALDHGDLSVEAGLTLDRMPKFVFKYEHSYKRGDEGSTSWGYTHPGGGDVVRGLNASLYGLDDHKDAFSLDMTHHIKATEFGVGVRYETGRMGDALKATQFPGEAIQQDVTSRQGTSYDLLNVHSFTETWLRKNVMLSTGFSYSDLDNDFSGSRIYGSDFDVSYAPNPQSGFGYYNLTGGSHLHEYVGDVNLLFRPSPHVTIVPSLRVAAQNSAATAHGTETLSDFAPAPFSAYGDANDLDVRERLDLTYNGITNWVLYARGELTEGQGNLTQNGGLVPINAIGIPQVAEQTDINRFFQKYNAGARWYPAARLTLDGGGYYKRNDYNYHNTVDSTLNDSPDRYPAYLTMQYFQTYDGYFRMTLRPRRNVTAISRYEYQYSTVETRPDPVSSLGQTESSRTISHILGEDVSWTPWSRLYLQAGFDYVLSQTKIPTGASTPVILPSQNDYWTVNATAGLVLDDKTDLKLSYFYYQADNYQMNNLDGLGYGAGEDAYSIAATLTRRITQNIRWSLKYAYSHYTDQTYGGHRDFQAHLVYSSLQYRF